LGVINPDAAWLMPCDLGWFARMLNIYFQRHAIGSGMW
jgi:hypothetical protein